MVLLPKKSIPELIHVPDNRLLLTTLEPYNTTSLIELAGKEVHLAQIRRRKIVQRDSRCEASQSNMIGASILGSWTCIAWSIASWTLLVCLLLPRTRKGQYSDENAYILTNYEDGSCLSHEHRDLLSSLHLDGSLTFSNLSSAATDFGLVRFSLPGAVIYPKSVRDVQVAVRAVRSSRGFDLTLAAKGRGHSVHGQAQALNGVVMEMSSLKGIRVVPHGEPGYLQPFVDAAGGELWIDVLKATLREGLAPRSWTDYLYLSIGGTLSNAGVGGQTFLFGPEISNVLQLDVVTGTGQSVKCSPTQNADLFHGVLGGLGQFGIITSARIILEPAHEKVRWIRVMYTDFAAFTRDQEMLVSQPPESAFDYIEGFVVLKTEDSINGWNSVPFDSKKIDPSVIPEEGGSVLYYIELVKNFSSNDTDTVNEAP